MRLLLSLFLPFLFFISCGSSDFRSEGKTAKKNSSTCFRASCPPHNWEGRVQKNAREAGKDLQTHNELFPNESHKGSTIINSSCK